MHVVAAPTPSLSPVSRGIQVAQTSADLTALFLALRPIPHRDPLTLGLHAGEHAGLDLRGQIGALASP
jgi:hypothetical protein